jgi:hypothetical protein
MLIILAVLINMAMLAQLGAALQQTTQYQPEVLELLTITPHDSADVGGTRLDLTALSLRNRKNRRAASPFLPLVSERVSRPVFSAGQAEADTDDVQEEFGLGLKRCGR